MNALYTPVIRRASRLTEPTVSLPNTDVTEHVHVANGDSCITLDQFTICM